MVDKYVYKPGTKVRVKVGGVTYNGWSPEVQASAKPAKAPKKKAAAGKAGGKTTKAAKKPAGEKKTTKRKTTKKPKPTIAELRKEAKLMGLDVPSDLKGKELRVWLVKNVKKTKLQFSYSPKKSTKKAGPTIAELRKEAKLMGVVVPKDLKGPELRTWLTENVETTKKRFSYSPQKPSSPAKEMHSMIEKEFKPPATPPASELAAPLPETAAYKCPPAFERSEDATTSYWIYGERDVCKSTSVGRINTKNVYYPKSSKLNHAEAVKKVLNYIAKTMGHSNASSSSFWEDMDSSWKIKWKGSLDATLGEAPGKWMRKMMVPFHVKDFEFQYDYTFIVVIGTPENNEFLKFLARSKIEGEGEKAPKSLSPQAVPSPQGGGKGLLSYFGDFMGFGSS